MSDLAIFAMDAHGSRPRHDYDVDILCSEIEEFSGIIVPTKHTVFGRQPDGRSVPTPLVVSIDRGTACEADVHRQLATLHCGLPLVWRNEMKEAGIMERLETAPTAFIENAGITFAYRRLGTRDGTPLILLQHFSGNMDSWDPAVVNALAKERVAPPSSQPKGPFPDPV